MFRLGEVGLVPSRLFPLAFIVFCAVQDIETTVWPSSQARKWDSLRRFMTKTQSDNNTSKLTSDDMLLFFSEIFRSYISI
jgi:hypothetical protein